MDISEKDFEKVLLGKKRLLHSFQSRFKVGELVELVEKDGIFGETGRLLEVEIIDEEIIETPIALHVYSIKVLKGVGI